MLFATRCGELVVCGLAMHVLRAHVVIGGLGSPRELSIVNDISLCAQACTGIGFGPAIGVGEIRLRIAAEALDGLPPVGRSASHGFIAPERYWEPTGTRREP